MGSYVNGIYLPVLDEVNWDDEIVANFRRVGDLGLNVKAPPFDAVGDGVTNDTAAFVAAKAALPASGGEIFVPPGIYKVDLDALDFSDSKGITIRGKGGRTGGSDPPSVITTAGTGSGSLINAKSSGGFRLLDIGLRYTSASFTGRMVDLRHSASGFDAGYAHLENVLFYSQPAATVQSAIGVDLDKCISSSITGCNFFGLSQGIVGKADSGSYSNQISIERCRFSSAGPNGTIPNGHIVNPGQAWYLAHNTHEAAGAGAAKAIIHDSGVTAKALAVLGSWFGDVTSGYHMTLAGEGFYIAGNYIGGPNTGGGIKFDADNTEGIYVAGNLFDGVDNCFDFTGTTGHQGLIAGNAYNGVNTKYAGTNPVGVHILEEGFIGFNGAEPAPKGTVTGSRGGNAALADLLTELAALGLITDSSS